jgi:hypothetical protein
MTSFISQIINLIAFDSFFSIGILIFASFFALHFLKKICTKNKKIKKNNILQNTGANVGESKTVNENEKEKEN